MFGISLAASHSGFFFALLFGTRNMLIEGCWFTTCRLSLLYLLCLLWDFFFVYEFSFFLWCAYAICINFRICAVRLLFAGRRLNCSFLSARSLHIWLRTSIDFRTFRALWLMFSLLCLLLIRLPQCLIWFWWIWRWFLVETTPLRGLLSFLWLRI